MQGSDKRRVSARVCAAPHFANCLAAVQQLTLSAGLPHLREFAMGSHLVLYAHSDTEVVLLSIKHHRQLTYITLQ